MDTLTEQKIRCVVAATELSTTANSATERAASLAQQWQVPLHILTVVGDGMDFDIYQNPEGDNGFCESASNITQPKIQAFAESIANKFGIRVHWAIRCGNASKEIIKFLDLNQGSLLVVGEHTQHWARDLFIGGTAIKVLQQSHRPVLLSRGNSSDQIHNILVATDFSDASINVLRSTCELFPNSSIHVLNAYQQNDLDRMRLDGFTEDEMTIHQKSAYAKATAQLEEFREKAALPCIKDKGWICRAGHPVATLMDYIDQQQVDLLVMARHGRGLIEQQFAGSVLHNLLYHAKSNILVIP